MNFWMRLILIPLALLVFLVALVAKVIHYCASRLWGIIVCLFRPHVMEVYCPQDVGQWRKYCLRCFRQFPPPDLPPPR
jgi:hypothetical protein